MQHYVLGKVECFESICFYRSYIYCRPRLLLRTSGALWQIEERISSIGKPQEKYDIPLDLLTSIFQASNYG